MRAVSVIIPALNEASWLGATLDAVRASFAAVPPEAAVNLELVVADNGSSDGTAAVAAAHGATVVAEPGRGVARARNAGARAAAGELLVFLDADTLVPPDFARVLLVTAVPGCAGGAFDTVQRPARRLLRWYLSLWRALGLMLHMAQGAAQFCRRDVFAALGGYDERLFMGEDVDFYWRLRRLARRRGERVALVRDVRVAPSARRFDAWPWWRTLVWTNPLVAGLLARRKVVWRGWHESPPR